MAMPSNINLIDLDFCLDAYGHPAWEAGPDLRSLANQDIRERLNRALSQFIRYGNGCTWGQQVWIRRFRSRRPTPRRSLLALPFTAPPRSSEDLKVGWDCFLKVARLLGWKAENEVHRNTRYRPDLQMDFWFVDPDRKLDALTILLTARKISKVYTSIEMGPAYKSIRKDTISIIKHIASLKVLLNRIDNDWFELVSEQDGRNWKEFSSSIDKYSGQNKLAEIQKCSMLKVWIKTSSKPKLKFCCHS